MCRRPDREHGTAAQCGNKETQVHTGQKHHREPPGRNSLRPYRRDEIYNREKGNIPGFSNYYISRTGKLYSKFTGSWKLVKPAMKDNGYLSNSLVGDGGKRKNFYRHRLVASIYIPNPNNYPQVCHKNNNPEDNRVGNLYWGTAKMNMGQCIEDKRFYFVGKERERKVNVELLISRYIEGIPRKDILEEFGISTGVLYKILRYNNIKLRK